MNRLRHSRKSRQNKCHHSTLMKYVRPTRAEVGPTGAEAAAEVMAKAGTCRIAPRGDQKKPQPQSHVSASSDTCERCRIRHGKDQHCLTSGKTCNCCNRQGYFILVCKKRQNRKAREVQAQWNQSEGGEAASHAGNSFWIDAAFIKESKSAWTASLPIGGRDVHFKINTGADISIMSESCYASLLSRPHLSACHIPLNIPG